MVTPYFRLVWRVFPVHPSTRLPQPSRGGRRFEGDRIVTPTKVLFGQSLLVLAIALAGIWGATQWAAFLLGNQPRLGTPWFFIAHYPIFEPFAFFFWWYWFDAYAPDVFAEASAFAAGGGIAGAALAITGSIWRARERKL